MHDEVKQFKISTTAGDITIKSDPTLGSREIRFEQPPSTTCARCSHAFTSRPDGFVDVALEAEIAAHQERCVIVGDHVRITLPTSVFDIEQWVEGELRSMERNAVGGFDGLVMVRNASDKRIKHVGTERSLSWGIVNTIRRIPRPQQGITSVRVLTGHAATTAAADLFTAGKVSTDQAKALAGLESWLPDSKPMQVVTTCPGYNAVFTIDLDPPDLKGRQAKRVADHVMYEMQRLNEARTRYLAAKVPKAPTIETPWMKFPETMSEKLKARIREPAVAPVLYDGLTAERCLHAYSASQRIDYGHRLTASQLAAARDLWSAQLRAKLAASAEAERTRVRVDDQSEP